MLEVKDPSVLCDVSSHIFAQQRLNHLMFLHVHKDRTNGLDLVDVANDFIFGSEHRKNLFGAKFSSSDLF